MILNEDHLVRLEEYKRWANDVDKFERSKSETLCFYIIKVKQVWEKVSLEQEPLNSGDEATQGASGDLQFQLWNLHRCCL